VNRRTFMSLLGGAAAWPVAARAQTKHMRRIGVLMGLVASDPEAQSRVAAFEGSLRERGWVKGRNVLIEYRWAGDGNVGRDHAAELLGARLDLSQQHAANGHAAGPEPGRANRVHAGD
jgi:putative ABC transport system substrate-binding protein